MRFAIVAAPGSDPGAASARASRTVTAEGAGIAGAARAGDEPYVLLLGRGARPRANAFSALTAMLAGGPGVVGGSADDGTDRRFGWMLAPASGVLHFEPALMTSPRTEAGVDALLRGAIDVPVHEIVFARRELLLEPLPGDPLAAMLELAERARDAGLEVVCRPELACDAPPLAEDDRGRSSALREIAARRPALRGVHRLPPNVRKRGIERELRLEGGRRVRVRLPIPALTILVHGASAELATRRLRTLSPSVVAARAVTDPAAALRAELRVRGDRYVLLVDAASAFDEEGFGLLVDAIEDRSAVALAAPDAARMQAGTALLAPGRIPQHIVPDGDGIGIALDGLCRALTAAGRLVRVPGRSAHAPYPLPAASATIVLSAAAAPEITHLAYDALTTSMRPGDVLIGIHAAAAQTTRRLLASNPHVALIEDADDPALTGGINRALGEASTDLVVFSADDVLFAEGALDALRDAFRRVPALGAAFPVVASSPGDERAPDAGYADIREMQLVAARRAAARARECPPIAAPVTPAFVVARAALEAVGGISPALGPSARGIAEFAERLRAAGYAVVRCEDALAHRFPAATSHHPVGVADEAESPVRASPEAAARGFDPSRRVPFGRPAAPRAATPPRIVVAVPAGDDAELQRAVDFIAACAERLDADAPVRLHLLLENGLDPAAAGARVRPVLAAHGRALERAVAVRIERVDDLAAWVAAATVRLAIAPGHARAAFGDAPEMSARALADEAAR